MSKMKLKSFQTERNLLRRRCADTLGKIGQATRVGQRPDLRRYMAVMQNLKKCASEQINQLPHRHVTLLAIQSVQRYRPSTRKLKWNWHPEQTSSRGDADATACTREGREVVQIEATTSPKPGGAIDSKMRKKLEELSKMKGRYKYYCVVSKSMAKRAKGIRDTLHIPAKSVRVVRVDWP